MDVLKTVCDILKVGMGLENDQIWIYNQKVDIPNDKRLYVVCSLEDENAYGVNLNHENDIDILHETTEINVRSLISIDIFSYGTKALEERFNVIGAMRSTYSLIKQETINFNISRRPLVFRRNYFDTPTAKLYSFHYEYAIIHIERNIPKEIPFYDDIEKPNIVVNK